MISDFVMSGLSTQLKAQIDQAKERETKFHSLVIGSSQNAAVIQEFDHNWAYDPAKPDALMEVLRGLRGFEDGWKIHYLHDIQIPAKCNVK